MCKINATPAITTTFQDNILTVVFDHGERKSFHCTEKLTLALRAWWRRLRLDFCAARNLDPECASITLLDLLTFTLDDEERTGTALRLGYPGNHDGIPWYHEANPDTVEEALACFFLSCFAPQTAKTNAPPKSLSHADTGSAIPA